VVALSSCGVTLLLERPPAGRDARLARDLLAAATGQWDLDPALRQFDWPPAFDIPGGAGGIAAERALRAFVEKELADQASQLLLPTEVVAGRLGAAAHAAEQLVIPDLPELGRDSVEKRRIWARLVVHRLAWRGTTIDAARQPEQEGSVAGDPGSPGELT